MGGGVSLPSWLQVVRADPSEYEKKILARVNVVADAYWVQQLLCQRMGRLTHEELIVLALDSRSHLLDMATVSSGPLDFLAVDFRRIFQVPLIVGAPAFLIVHNHPSGTAVPSPKDKSWTRELVKAAEILDLAFIDHVILTGATCYFSMREEGLMK
jgi:DNA repair protein RadC